MVASPQKHKYSRTIWQTHRHRTKTVAVQIVKLERVKGIEPSAQALQVSQSQDNPQAPVYDYTQIRAQISEPLGRDLAKVVGASPILSQPLKTAIPAIVEASAKPSHGDLRGFKIRSLWCRGDA